MAGHGGTRPGAGRKRKSETHAGAVAAAEGRIRDRLPALVDTLFALAEGVRVERVTPDGAVDVFTTPPDLKAIVYLIDRVLGRPTKAVALSGDDKGPVVVKVLQGGLWGEL